MQEDQEVLRRELAQTHTEQEVEALLAKLSSAKRRKCEAKVEEPRG